MKQSNKQKVNKENYEGEVKVDVTFKKEHSFDYCVHQMVVHCKETWCNITNAKGKNVNLENKEYCLWFLEHLWLGFYHQAKKQAKTKKQKQLLENIKDDWYAKSKTK